MKSFSLATFCVCILPILFTSSTANVIKSQPDDAVKPLLEFIRDQEEKFQLGSENEAVIILGDRFAGKSSLSLLLTDGEMVGVEDNMNYIDENGRIVSIFDDRHKLPVIDVFNGTTYYDWTGFGDLRGIEYDVLLSQLIKKLAKSRKKVKFLFTIPYFYSEEHHRIDRVPVWEGNFMNFAEQATDLIKNIEKYKDAIGFVITKSRAIRYSNETFIPISDESTIKGFVHYLKSLKEALEKRLEKRVHRVYNLENIIKFVDILLEKKGDKHKIGVFQKPSEAGPVKLMKPQQNEKIAIRRMINDQLQFIETDINDFGYSVKYETKKTDIFKQLITHLEQFNSI